MSDVHSSDGWGQRVAGRCPACGNSTLFVAKGQHITCSLDVCPDPTMVADFLLGHYSLISTGSPTEATSGEAQADA